MIEFGTKLEATAGGRGGQDVSCPGDELVHGREATTVIQPCPRWLLITVYFFYLGLVTADSYPLFANISWGIEGERVGSAQMVLNGGLPIRDVYLPHGPFPEVIRPLLAFWFFGESLAADRIMGILVEPLVFVAAAFYVWRVFPTGFWRLVSLLGFALFPLQLLTRHIPVFLALGLLTAWVYERRTRQLVWAGIITGLGYVMGSVDQATFLVATMLAFPFAVLAEQIMRQPAGVGRGTFKGVPIRSVFVETAYPLFGGLWAVAIASFHVLAEGFALGLTPLQTALVFVVVLFGVAVPSAPGFVGTFHGFCVAGLGMVAEIEPTLVGAYATLLHGSQWIAVNAVGVGYLLADPLASWGTLVRIAREL